jgi:hypothetical protein
VTAARTTPRTRKAAKPTALTPEQIEALTFVQFIEAWNSIQSPKLKTPRLHKRFARWLERTQGARKRHLNSFRFSGKSHVVCLYVAFRLLKNCNATFIIASSGRDLAQRNAKFIRNVLETHPWTAHLVPQSRDDSWKAFSFTVNRTANVLEESVQSLSVDGRITGKHCGGPDPLGKATHGELILDDVETSEHGRSAKEREDLHERIQELTALCPNLTYVGTFHAGAESIYVKLIEVERIEHLLIPIYEDTPEGRVYAWPERWPQIEIDGLFAGASQAYVDSQYLCKPANLATGGLPIDYAETYTDQFISNTTTSIYGVGRTQATCGKWQIAKIGAFWDLARGDQDDSVLAIVAETKDRFVLIHRTFILTPTKGQGWTGQITEALGYCKQYGARHLAVEINIHREMPADIRAVDQKLKTENKGWGGHVHPIHETMSKEVRTRLALEAPLDQGRIKIHSSVLEGKFPKQVADFPGNMKPNSKAPNDHLDAVVGAIRELPAVGTLLQQDHHSIEVAEVEPGRSHDGFTDREWDW